MHFALTSAAVHCCWITAHLYDQQISMDVIAATQACSEPVLQSNPEHWRMQIALTSAAVHCCWITAHLYEQLMSIVVIALTQACFVPVLQSSTEQWGLHFALFWVVKVLLCKTAGSSRESSKSHPMQAWLPYRSAFALH